MVSEELRSQDLTMLYYV